MSPTPTNYTITDGGEWLSIEGVDISSINYAAVLFSDGTVWDDAMQSWIGDLNREPFIPEKPSFKTIPHAGGRPTDYTPDLGEKILALMNQGLSLAAAAADCDIHRQRVYDWVKKFPEFEDTISLAKVKRQSFLEKRLLSADQGPIVTSTIFALKNAAGEDWREKNETETTINKGDGWDAVFAAIGDQSRTI